MLTQDEIKGLRYLKSGQFTPTLQGLSNRSLIFLARNPSLDAFSWGEVAQLALVLADRLERTGCARPESTEQRLAADFDPRADMTRKGI